MKDNDTDERETLRLTDDGIELPDFLRGYSGSFTMRTPAVTGEIETSAGGLPDVTFYDGPLAVYPSDGEYNDDLSSGEMAFATPPDGETIYRIVDERGGE